MGFKLADRAMRNSVITGPTKAVLIVVGLKADDETGELFPSQETIAEAAGLSMATVRRALGWLEERGIIRRERRRPTNGYRTTDLITLDGGKLASYQAESKVAESKVAESYQAESYQAESKVAESYLADSNELPLTQQRATAQTDSYNKDYHSVGHTEGHTDLSVIEPDLPRRTFAEFWLLWPRKVSKPQAEKAWTNAIKRAPPEVIYDTAVAYATNPYLPEKQFIPHAATWLNGDRWNDELPGPHAEKGSNQVDRNLAYLQQLAARRASETRGITS